MKPELEKALNKELKKEWLKSRGKWLVLGLGIVLILAVYTPVFSNTIYGQTTALTNKDRGHESKVQMKVKLDSGQEITILADKNVNHVEGERVEISKMTSVVGMATYQFIRYVE